MNQPNPFLRDTCICNQRKSKFDWLRGVTLWLLVWLVGQGSLAAQRAQFRQWNAGAAIGLSPMNGNSLLPTLTGHYRNLSAEISPYPYSHGIMAAYHFSPFPLLKKAHFTVDVGVLFARQNANWYVKFPRFISYPNLTRTGVTAGGAIYFLRRFALRFAAGVQYVASYGPDELKYHVNTRNYLLETGVIGLHFRLFQTFKP